MKFFNWEDLHYDEWESPCEVHIIEDKITIIYDFTDLKINYYYRSIISYSNNDYFLNLLTEILKTDIQNMIYFDKIKFNDSNLEFNNESDLLVNNNNNYEKIDSKIITKELISENELITIYFEKNNNEIDKIIRHYIWFMRLTRYVVDIYEEDNFYMEKEIKKRRKCYNYNVLYCKLLKIHKNI